jgi:hypothetical protein
VSWEDLQENPENSNYIIAGFAYGKDKNKKDDKKIPSLNLNKKAYNLSLVFTDLPSSLELLHKDNIHLSDFNCFKYYTAETVKKEVRDANRDGDRVHVIM